MNSPQTTVSGFKAVTNTFIRVLPIGIYAGLVLMAVIFQNIEAYYLLKRVLERNKIEKVIISFAPFHLDHHDTFLHRTLKFNFFDSEI